MEKKVSFGTGLIKSILNIFRKRNTLSRNVICAECGRFIGNKSPEELALLPREIKPTHIEYDWVCKQCYRQVRGLPRRGDE